MLAELLARIEEQVVDVVRREMGKAVPPAVGGSPDGAANAGVKAVERLVGQRMDESARSTATRLDSLEERLATVSSGVDQAVSGLSGAFEKLLEGRLAAFENHLTSLESLRREQVADALEFGDRAAVDARQQLSGQIEHLSEAQQQLYGQLESRVASELQAQCQAIAAQGDAVVALGQRVENNSARRRARPGRAAAPGGKGGGDGEAAEGTTHGNDLDIDIDGDGGRTGSGEGGAAGASAAVDERLDELLDLVEDFGDDIRQTAGQLEALHERVEAQAASVALRFDGVAEAMAADRQETARRLDWMSQSLAEQTRMLEAGAASADAHLTDIREDVMGAAGSLIELVTARTADDPIPSATLRLVEAPEPVSATQAGDRPQAGTGTAIELAGRSAEALQSSVETAVASGIESLRNLLAERIGPEATLPELLLAFGEAQEEAVNRAVAQVGDGPLQAFSGNISDLQQATLSLIHQNEAAALASQIQVDGLQATLSTVVNLLEWLRGNQGDKPPTRNQPGIGALPPGEAVTLLDELTGMNTELLRHRGWLEGISSHLHAVNDNLAALQPQLRAD